MVSLKNIVIGIAIMILTAFVAIYGIQTFYKSAPQYEEFCGNVTYPVYEINNSQQCELMNGKWNPMQTVAGKSPAPATPSGYCDLTYYCQQQYNEAQKTFSKNLFLISIPVGVILLVIGGALFSLEAVGVGIMLGGVITLIYGASSYWPNANNMFRFGISLLGLIIVIILAYWLNQKDFFIKLIRKKKKED